MKNTRKGFTLIELVIVVAIIGILALMVIPNFATVTEDAKVKTFKSNCKTVQSAIGMFQAANKGEMPTEMKDLIDNKFLQKDPNGEPAKANYTVTSTAGLTADYTDKDNQKWEYSTEVGFTDPAKP